MKVLLVNKYHYRRGGSETYYFALADALKSLGNEVVYFAMKSEENFPCDQSKYFIDDVDYTKKGLLTQVKQAIKLMYSFEAKKKFGQLIREEKPDVVHINLVHRQITLSILDVCKKYNVPVFFTAHDLVCCCPVGSLLKPDYSTCRACYSGKYSSCVKNRCIKNSLSKSIAAYLEATFYRKHNSYEKINTFITPSDFYRREIMKSRITHNKVIHMTNLLPVETEYKRYKEKEKYFLFLGSLSKNKGVFTLLKAFHKADLSGWKLKYAGTGEEFERLRQYINENNLGDSVKLCGFVTGEELSNITRNSYAIVLPSEWYENGPYALMEPLSYGKPIIGANIGGIPELAIPNKTGWLFESGNEDQLVNVLKKATEISDEDYKKLSISACEFARQKFDAYQYTTKLISIYNEARTK